MKSINIKIGLVLSLFFFIDKLAICQNFNVVTKDKDTVECVKFTNEIVYKIYIKTAITLHNQRPYLAYLYQIDSNGVVVCNVNPKKIDTSKLNEVIFRKFYFKNITSLKINRDKNGLKGALIMMSSSLLSGIITYQTGDGFYFSREEKVDYIVGFVFSLGFYTVYLPMVIPKKIKLNKNNIGYDNTIQQLVKKTKYKVY